MNLDNVTLVCVDGKYQEFSKPIFEKVKSIISFHSSIFIEGISSIKNYNLFIVKELATRINTDFCMIIQYDGYPLNISAWRKEFLDFDYIGAPWYTQPGELDKTVGNGGFSIRSRNFLLESSKLEYSGDVPEDVFLCRKNSKLLRDNKIKFAPHDLAYLFSVEDMPYKGQFGFHGKGTIEINKRLGIFK